MRPKKNYVSPVRAPKTKAHNQSAFSSRNDNKKHGTYGDSKRQEQDGRSHFSDKRPLKPARPFTRKAHSELSIDDNLANSRYANKKNAHNSPYSDFRKASTNKNKAKTPFRSHATKAVEGNNNEQLNNGELNDGAKGLPQKGERVQKVLAQMDWGARREIENWIRAGDVWINGKIAELGAVLQVGDKVEVIRGQKNIDESRAPKRKEVERFMTWHPQINKLPRVLLYHKPEGEVVSRSDPQNRPSAFANLPRLKGSRWVNIGRLDIASSGLIMFSDDGELANKLMHPSANLEREYAVRINGSLSEAHIRNLLQGVELEDGVAVCQSVVPMSAKSEGRNQWYKFVLTEGKNREIRRMVETLGYQVSRLMRLRYGPVFMPRGLRRGKYEELDRASVEKMLRLLKRK